MNSQSAGRGISCPSQDSNCTPIESHFTGQNHFRAKSSNLVDVPLHAGTGVPISEDINPFPTVEVPDHAHYTIGTVILFVGITGVLGNFLVIYAFSRSKSLRTPSNMFIINLAVSDFLMSITQAPVFFITSLHKRWVFGEKGCELYAFCGALFGIGSMITLMVIAADRYFVITRPLASIGAMTLKRAGLILVGVWCYSLGWSLPPFFGWSAFVPEGLLTSCTWDYMTFTPSVRAYTMLLFTFIFLIPLLIIICCYVFIFKAIRAAGRAVQKINSGESQKLYEKMRSDWKMAKIALIVILLYVVSWAPYSCVALTAFAGYSHLLTPYMNSVPAVIAKASAIHNPIIYAITHPKYRAAIAKYVPFLRVILRVSEKDLRSSGSYTSMRRSTLTSQSSSVSATNTRWAKSRHSSTSDSDSCWTESEADVSSLCSPSSNRQVTTEIGEDITVDTIIQSQPSSNNSLFFNKTSSDSRDISVTEVSQSECSVFPLPGI
ncbi:melanopsin-like [Lepisosteus oculatus]|uniref:melanopsin-like n=1 Tax=Lepisosteus oculatus TaxID=7918 RepID=UPI003712A5EF